MPNPANTVEVQFMDQLDALERRIHLLKVEYDKYFMGILKKSPAKEYDELTTLIRNMGKVTIRNTAHNFRYQTLKARFLTYDQYWQRILKQIEDGTFKRDQFRYSLKEKESEALKRQSEERKAEDAKKLAEEQKREEKAREVRDTIADQKRLQGLFNEFVAARKQCNERVDNVQFDKMVEFMQQQTNQIKQKYQAKAVEFQVVVDGGKTKLKAVPVK